MLNRTQPAITPPRADVGQERFSIARHEEEDTGLRLHAAG